MTFFNTLLISVLLISFFRNETLRNEPDRCSSLTVEHTLQQGQNGKYTLTLEPKGGIGNYKIFIWVTDGDLLSEDHKQREFKNLNRGRYNGVVGDENKCSKKFEIVIP
jgi:outer membrane lipoprotein-sorting protein